MRPWYVLLVVGILLTLAVASAEGCGGNGHATAQPAPATATAVATASSDTEPSGARNAAGAPFPTTWIYGNCVVMNGGAVEVTSEDVLAKGGHVFERDTDASTYYSLPNGRCVVLTGPPPRPTWVPSQMENEAPITPRPTVVLPTPFTPPMLATQIALGAPAATPQPEETAAPPAQSPNP